mmetsp:Transcript_2625/g.4780  ORF Transcript_2625/g.4780 Transcript_2625/m.4780 type:complete len:297 (+) Transcript_2625:272-1162(+)
MWRGSRHLLEEGNRVVECCEEPIDVVRGVVEMQGSARRSRDVEVPVERLGAVVAGADGDTGIVEEGADVVGMYVRDVEGRKRRTAEWAGDLGRGAVQVEVVREVAQAVPEVLGQVRLVVVDVAHAQVGHVVHSGAQADCFRDRRRAGLEFVWEGVAGEVVEEHVLDHLAAPHERRHALHHRRLPVQHPDARRSAHLVAGEDQPVAVELLHVDRHVRHALARIDQVLGADRVCNGRDLGGVADAAQGVRHMCKGDEFCAVVYKAPQVVHVEGLVLGQAHVAYDSAGALGDDLPGDDV